MGEKKKYSGVVVPMISPLKDDLSIDEKSVEKIILKFKEAGVAPFVLGTTGESESMSLEQKEKLVKVTSGIVNGKSILYAGVSDTSLQTSIDQANKYARLGVDVVVATVPYYYPVNDDQIQRYFTDLADSIACPLIIYNMPSTTGVSLSLEVLDKLSLHRNIVGLKDSERSVERLDASLKLWKDRDDFSFLIGWAAMSVYGLQNGANGIVPSTGNFCPELYQNLYNEAVRSNIKEAEELQEKTNSLSLLYQKNRDLSHSLPALKLLMSGMGLCLPNVLPPMYRMQETEELSYKEYLKKEFQEFEGMEING